MGISTVAVFKKIKTGVIPAHKIGRNYAIDPDILGLKGGRVSSGIKNKIGKAVGKTIAEYGEALKKLGRE